MLLEDARPDLEIIEDDGDEGGPDIAHLYCLTCNRGPHLVPGMVAFCGYIYKYAAHGWPCTSQRDEQRCVVCEDLDLGSCPGCGL